MPPGPVSALEADLIARFSTVLGTAVNVETDFFEAGGDSVGAMRLIARLARGPHSALTPGELFLHSTPRRMAARLEELASSAASTPRHLVRMRGDRIARVRTAILFVHPIGGQLVSYGKLAQRFDSHVPLYGLQAAVTPKRSYASIEERCAAYVREAFDAHDGPLAIGGYSLGGVLALEMAAQARRAGREVPLVFLLDSHVPTPALRGADKARFRLEELVRFSWAERRIWLQGQITRRLFGESDGPDLGEGAPLIDADEMRRLHEQALAWRPARYEGDVTLFRAERDVRGYSIRPGVSRWSGVCPRLRVVRLACDHTEVVAEPQAQEIATEIARHLA